MDKICGICGIDCSDRPRVKDAQGRYYCKSCAMDRAAQHDTEQPELPPQENADPYALGNEDLGAAALSAGMLGLANQQTQCPGCQHLMPPGAHVCISCGYNTEKGIQSSTKIEKSAGKGGRKYRCRECDYDLTGLRSSVCPECGTRIATNKRRNWDAETEKQVIRTEWTKPTITAGIGAAGVLGVLSAHGMLDILPWYGLFLCAEVFVGYIILWFSFRFLGDIGTPLLNLLRLTALYLVVDALWFLVIPIPSFWIRNGVMALAYIGLFCNFFDVDWEDAWIVMFINWLAKMAIIITVVVMYSGYF